MKTHKSKYSFGQTLYVRNDPEQNPFDCVAVMFAPNGVLYELQGHQGGTATYYEFQVSDKQDIHKTFGIN